MTPVPDLTVLSSPEKDTLITALLAQVQAQEEQLNALMARVVALEAENAALREKLRQPPKTPDNSSTPPSQGHKTNGERKAEPKGKAHPGAHRPLHPNPTRRREVLAGRCAHCAADVSGVAQVPVHA
jgi:transposase